jgi:hypothetical protein
MHVLARGSVFAKVLHRALRSAFAHSLPMDCLFVQKKKKNKNCGFIRACFTSGVRPQASRTSRSARSRGSSIERKRRAYPSSSSSSLRARPRISRLDSRGLSRTGARRRRRRSIDKASSLSISRPARRRRVRCRWVAQGETDVPSDDDDVCDRCGFAVMPWIGWQRRADEHILC